MGESYKILDWDTNFFQYKVAEIKKDILSESPNGEEILQSLSDQNVKLAYYTSNTELGINLSSDYEIDLIIHRVPLEKKIINEFPVNENISFYTENYPDKSLIELAQLAGSQGRFGLDPKISNEICDDIFKNWIINSVNKKMASHILVYRENSQIVGFATIDIRDDKGYAPLFAVDRKFEGKGVSFALMRAVETVLKRNGCSIIVGGTQKLNEKALKVYKRFGMVPQQPEFIYHLWNKNI